MSSKEDKKVAEDLGEAFVTAFGFEANQEAADEDQADSRNEKDTDSMAEAFTDKEEDLFDDVAVVKNPPPSTAPPKKTVKVAKNGSGPEKISGVKSSELKKKSKKVTQKFGQDLPPPKKKDRRPDLTVSSSTKATEIKKKTIEKTREGSRLILGDMKENRALRMKARKVRRVVRHIDPWSVLTFSVLFHLVIFATLMLATSIIFVVGDALGIIDGIESAIKEQGSFDTFELKVGSLLWSLMLLGGVLTIFASIALVILTVLFNLISDLVGGIRVTVVEEDLFASQQKTKSVASDTNIG